MVKNFFPPLLSSTPNHTKHRRYEQSRDLPSTEAAEQLHDQTEPSPATRDVLPQTAILRDSVQNIGLSIISRPGISSYIPTAFNMFAMLSEMCYILAGNPRVNELCPEFFTPVLYLYYSHVVYFHILRARACAGTTSFTQLEKRLLSQYERIAPAEDWPIAAPLAGFIQALGSHKTVGSYYSWIVPSLPDFSRLNKNKGLAGLEKVPGMLRLPIVPALQKLLRNFTSGIADYNSGILHPSRLPLGEDNQLIGISSSSADSQSFLAIAHNLCWKMPAETGFEHAFSNTILKRRRISRWNVPDVPNTATLNTAESFLGFGFGQSFDWMKYLLMTASSVNRFFPNSTNLAEIPPFTTLGSLTHVEYHRIKPQPTALKDTWYSDRAGAFVDFKGFLDTEDGLLDTRLGIATSTNAEFLPGYFPETVTNADPVRKGPFFMNNADAKANRERNAVFLSEGYVEQDPAVRYSQLITEYFDPTGGKKVN